MSRPRGFTLIEVMITVAIIAILAAIAIPSYADYVKRGRITEAVSALAGMRVKMEQYFQDNRVYNGTPPACNATSIAPKPADTANFAFTCVAAASTYLVTATGQGTMTGFAYTINEGNNRATTSVPSGWTLTANCWVLKKDGSC